MKLSISLKLVSLILVLGILASACPLTVSAVRAQVNDSAGTQPKTFSLQSENTGDDGETNWDFIVPVTHQLTVPNGYTGISTAQQLAAVEDTDGKYILMNDIDLSAWGNWTPIDFEGILDGNGYTIKNMKIELTNSGGTVSVGLFSRLTSGTVRNLGMVGSEINVMNSVGFSFAHVGGIVGSVNSLDSGCLIENCYNTGAIDVTNAAESIAAYVGGVVGLVDSADSAFTLENCYNTGALSVKNAAELGFACVGGTIGWLTSSQILTIENSYNTGALSVMNVADFGSAYVGGIGGYSDFNGPSSTLNNCYNTGALDVTNSADHGNVSVGGIWGQIYAFSDSLIENCYNAGTLSTVSSADLSYIYVGGILGQIVAFSDSLIENCYNQGTLNAVDCTGGIVGKIDDSNAGAVVTIENCYNTGKIDATGTEQDLGVGGIVGYAWMANRIENCYNAGAINVKNFHQDRSADVGGIAGYVRKANRIENCYSTGAISVTNSVKFSYALVGGVVGYMRESSPIDNCYNTGAITVANTAAETYACLGGLVGRIMDGNPTDSGIGNCYNTGVLKLTITDDFSSAEVGGLMGMISRFDSGMYSIENSYNSGAINVTISADSSFVRTGGIVSYSFNPGSSTNTIKNCYNSGAINSKISGKDSAVDAGGIVCLIAGDSAFTYTIENCYNNGLISTAVAGNRSAVDAGGIVALIASAPSAAFTLKNCYYLNTNAKGVADNFFNAPLTTTNVKARTDAQLRTKSSFTGFDFTAVWAIDAAKNGGYPYLQALGAPDTILPQSISLNRTTVTVGVKKTVKLSATILPANTTNKIATWSSSDTTIAAVNPLGVVTGKKVGTATITAKTSNNLTITCQVTVIIPVTKVKLNKTSATIPVKQTIKLTATVSPTNATNKKVTWSTSDNTVASVSNGKVTGLKVGKATITATADGKKATCKITVKKIKPVTSVKIANAPATLIQGQKTTLKVTVSPAGATNKTVTWSTSDKRIATVDPKTGKVTAQGPGTATITATAKDGSKKSGRAKITVHSYVSMQVGKSAAIMNSKKTTIDNQGAKPFKISGKTMLPLRFVGEKMGGKVKYVNDQKPITMSYGNKKVAFTLNSKTMTVYTNGKKTATVTLDVAAQKRNGRTYIPLRAISQALGFDVYYQPGTEYIIVNNPKMTPSVRKVRLNEAKRLIK